MRITGGGNIYQIYVDSYFLFNFWMNLLILFLCRFFTYSRVSQKRILAAALMAAFGECVILLFPLGGSLAKIILGFGGGTIVMLLWLFRPHSLKAFYRILLTAYGAGIFLGGSLLVFQRFFGRNRIHLMGLSIAGGLFVLMIPVLYKKMQAGEKSNLVQVELFFSDGKSKKLTALIDSGNSLIEPISQKPVSIVSGEAVLENKSGLLPQNFRLVPFCSVGKSKGLLEAFFIEKIKIYGAGQEYITNRALIGIAKEEISTGNHYQMILHPRLLENQEGRE